MAGAFRIAHTWALAHGNGRGPHAERAVPNAPRMHYQSGMTQTPLPVVRLLPKAEARALDIFVPEPPSAYDG